MNWNDVAETVSKVAPTLGGAFAGPGGYAIGAGIAKLLGVEDSPQAVQAALQNDPQAAVKLQELENDMEKARIQAEVSDRDSARELQQTALESGKGEFQNWLAAGVLIGGVIMLGAVAFMPMDGLSDNIRMYVLGFLTAAMTQVLNYFFGSTQWGNRFARHPAELQSKGGLYDEIRRK